MHELNGRGHNISTLHVIIVQAKWYLLNHPFGKYLKILTEKGLFSILQGEGGTVQPQPAGTVATVPYYAQPAPVSMVSRPQVVIPVTGQPPFHAVTRPTIVHSTPVPTQVHWQPAQVQYQEVRPAAFQPVVHYGAVPQTSSGGPGQAAYAVPTGAGVHYVRGVKDTQAQGSRILKNHYDYSSCVKISLFGMHPKDYCS